MHTLHTHDGGCGSKCPEARPAGSGSGLDSIAGTVVEYAGQRNAGMGRPADSPAVPHMPERPSGGGAEGPLDGGRTVSPRTGRRRCRRPGPGRHREEGRGAAARWVASGRSSPSAAVPSLCGFPADEVRHTGACRPPGGCIGNGPGRMAGGSDSGGPAAACGGVRERAPGHGTSLARPGSRLGHARATARRRGSKRVGRERRGIHIIPMSPAPGRAGHVAETAIRLATVCGRRNTDTVLGHAAVRSTGNGSSSVVDASPA